MNKSNQKFEDIDEYHASQPAEIQGTLEKIRHFKRCNPVSN